MLLEQINKEWNGSCYGISLAMLLNKNQSVDLEYLGVDDFYDIKPYTNVKARSFMNYLYLSQFSSAYNSTKLFGADTYKQGFLQRLLGLGKSKDSLKEFLEKFVTELQDNQTTNGLPVGFLYSQKGKNGVSGHCILATGISHKGSEYTVNLYDMNTVSPYQCGMPAAMTISDDYSSFRYNGLESRYVELAYLDTQKVLGTHFEDYDDFSTRIKSIESERTGASATMYLNPGVTIMDGGGKKISYDAEGMSGDMIIHDIATVYAETAKESADSQLSVLAEESDEYEISSKGDTNVTTCDSNQFMSLSGKNINLVTTDLEKTTVKGNSASYQLSVDSSIQDCDVLCISADSDEATYRYGADKLSVESETGISNIEVTALNGIEKEQQSIELNANQIEIYNDSEEGKITVLASNENGEVEKKTIGTETELPSASAVPEVTPSASATPGTSVTVPPVLHPTPSPAQTPSGGPSQQPSKGTVTLPQNTGAVSGTPSQISGGTTPGVTLPEGSTSGKIGIPGKVTGLKLKAKKKALLANWKKVSGASGYQIWCSTSKKFQKKSVKTKKKTKLTIEKLKTKKAYFVKVRAYAVNSGKKVYGAWSKTMKKTVK